jgi:hypothetical protein
MTQTAMQKRIMEALEKAVNRNKELKHELEMERAARKESNSSMEH